MDIGFIGTGSMGAAMVPHLVTAGHSVKVWNRTRAAAAAIPDVIVIDAPADAFAADVVFTMLADDKAVRSVVLDAGALAAAQPGTVHVMLATISLALVEELKTAHAAAGIGYVAAPVFGVPAQAAAAQLNVLVAGAPNAVATVMPLLDVLGRKVWPLGDDPVRANVAKIAGNLMLALAMEAMGEASALTQHYGVSAADFLDIVTNTIFASPSYQRYGGFIGSDTYNPGFKLPLGMKDVDLALAAAADRGAALPSADIVRGTMQGAIDAGFADRDWSVLAKIARRRAGLGDDVA
jgi:3-hydroxyisobutyrate dehydrogenase-like beta-hydroxyacid dehydrogenase